MFLDLQCLHHCSYIVPEVSYSKKTLTLFYKTEQIIPILIKSWSVTIVKIVLVIDSNSKSIRIFTRSMFINLTL